MKEIKLSGSVKYNEGKETIAEETEGFIDSIELANKISMAEEKLYIEMVFEGTGVVDSMSTLIDRGEFTTEDIFYLAMMHLAEKLHDDKERIIHLSLYKSIGFTKEKVIEDSIKNHERLKIEATKKIKEIKEKISEEDQSKDDPFFLKDFSDIGGK